MLKLLPDVLSVRNGRGTKFTKIGSLTKGKIVTIWSIDTDKDGSLWGPFRYDSNNIGFNHMRYVAPC